MRLSHRERPGWAEGERFEPSIRLTTVNGFETVSNVAICRYFSAGEGVRWTDRVFDLEGFPAQDHAPVPSSTFGNVHQPSTHAKSSVDLIVPRCSWRSGCRRLRYGAELTACHDDAAALLSVMGHASTDQIRR